METVLALSGAVDAKDRYTSGHSKRVAEYSKMLAQKMGKSKEEQDMVYQAGLLHDVGKIRVPEGIINKPGKLTAEEYETIKLHPGTGFHILKGIDDNHNIALGAKFHHERYDGTGYPNGIEGKDIPEIARIIGVADAYDAMASNRSYRKALPQEVVKSEIEKGKGIQFDPEIADLMLQMIEEDKDYLMRQDKEIDRTILIVDDDEIVIKTASLMIKDEQAYHLISALSGKEALELLEEKEVDLILLDMMMPEMDGFETLEKIREKYDTPVVFMTGEKSKEVIDKMTNFDIDDLITKPLIKLQFKEVLHSILN